MCHFSLSKIERELSRPLSSPAAEARLLLVLQRIPPELGTLLKTWPHARKWLDAVGAKSEIADQLLRPAIIKMQSDRDEIWNSILLYLFFSPLIVIHRCLYQPDDSSSLFSQLTWDFFRVVNQVDLTQRKARIGQKIINDTQHHTKSKYWESRQCPEQTLISDQDNRIGCFPARYAMLAQPDFEIEKAWAIARLKSLVKRKILSKTDFKILLGCYLYGHALDEMAVHLGVPYEVVKKRRQRAVKKLQKYAPRLSPNHPESPLYQTRRTNPKEVKDG